MYLWPGEQQYIWDTISTALPSTAATDPSFLLVGDFNIELALETPKPDSLLQQIVQEWGLLQPPGPTWKGRSGTNPKTLDGGLVPIQTLHAWHATAKWATLSDHAIVTLRRGPKHNNHNPACSPGRYWALPEAARAELRRTWGCVAVALGVPPSDRPTPTLASVHRCPPGETPNNDPVHEVLLADSHTERSERPSDVVDPNSTETGQTRFVAAPLLKRWGIAFTRASFDRWWRKWRKTGPTSPPEKQELARVARSTELGPHDVSPALGNWLLSVHGPTTLTPLEAQQWLGIWTTLENASRASTRFSSGATVDRPALGKAVVIGRAVHKPRGQRSSLQDAMGNEVSDPKAIGEALLATRRDIWFDKPKWLPDSSSLLEAYMRSRSNQIPTSPDASLPFLRGCVLSAHEGSKGHGGVPARSNSRPIH